MSDTRPATDELRLCNRADGIDGHYCIGRQTKNHGYWEYWNKGKWESVGQLFIGEAVAESVRLVLSRLAAAERERDSLKVDVAAFRSGFQRTMRTNSRSRG
jgi:hypothetical protein